MTSDRAGPPVTSQAPVYAPAAEGWGARWSAGASRWLAVAWRLVVLLVAGALPSCAPRVPARVHELAISEASSTDRLSAPATVPAVSMNAAPSAGRLTRDGGTGGLQEVWISLVARPGPARDPVVLVPRAYVTLAAYVEGALVYEQTDYRAAGGLPFHVIPLPVDREEVAVSFRVVSRYTQVGLVDRPRAGEHAALLQQMLVRDLPRLALAFALLFSALVAFGLAVRSRLQSALVALGVLGVGLGAWSLFQTRSRAFLPLGGEWWFAAWWLGPTVASAGTARFVEVMFGAGPHGMVRWLWWSFAGAAAASFAALFLGAATFAWAAPPLYLLSRSLLVVGVVLVVLFVAGKARAGSVEAGIFLLGFLVAGLGAVHSVAVGLGLLESEHLFADFGYATVGLALAAIVRRRFRSMESNLEQYAAALDRHARERASLTQDLHDGIWGVVTNVRLIAERARSGPTPAERERLLGAISELAGEGMAELRALMAGFESMPRSWREVAAELRRAGTAALEPHGIRQRFVSEISGAPPEPDAAAFVGLLRMHREALVNVIKHARARNVEVAFAVDAHRLTLRVSDDGVGLPAAGGDGSGRGMRSMRARARTLGGVLRTGPGAGAAGTSVTLELPFATGRSEPGEPG